MPTVTVDNAKNMDVQEKKSDQDVVRLAKRIAIAYGSDKVRLLASRDVRRAVLLHDIDAINRIITKVPQMSPELRLNFCDAFVGEDMMGLDLATPAILGDAYRAISKRVRSGDKGQQERLDKLAAHIDDLSTDFANSGGMVVSQREWPLVDVTNIADVYEGFGSMLDARKAEIDAASNPDKIKEIDNNLEQIKVVVSDYDESWGLMKVRNEDAPKLADRWEDLYGVLNRAKIFEETKEKLASQKFLDSKKQVIPQFVSGKQGDKKKYETYERGFDIARGGRLDSIVEIARHNIAKRHVADFNFKIDEAALESELNEEILNVLFEISTMDKIVQKGTEDTDKFADEKYREEFVNSLAETTGEISDAGYNAAIEAQTNATVGWGARLKRKIGKSKKLDNLWKKVNQPLERIDDMADVRMSRGAVARRKKRRDFCWGILQGFDTSSIVSAFITIVATAAAAKYGVSLAVSLAILGGISTLTLIAIQFAQWVKAQKKAGRPVSWEEFKKNKQLVRSFGTSGLAMVAMGFAAGGLAGIATGAGLGALALGAYNNGKTVYHAARDTKMSKIQAIAWAIAKAGSIVLGGFTGRYVAQGLTSMYNRVNPDNTWFQNKEMIDGEPKKISDEVTHEETTTHYTDEMLQSAESVVKDWYAKDFPNNPEKLQQDIDIINQYNAEHHTNIDPYRALRIIKMAQPERFSFTDLWSDRYHYTPEQINSVAHALDTGVANPDAMSILNQMDIHNVGVKGQIGPVESHIENQLYSNPGELPTQTIKTVVDKPAVWESTKIPRYDSVKGDGIGTVGNYEQDEYKSTRTGISRNLDSFLARVRQNRRNKVPDSISPVVPKEEPQDEILPVIPPVVPKEEPQDEILPVIPPVAPEEEQENAEKSLFTPVIEEKVQPTTEQILSEPQDEDLPILEPLSKDEQKLSNKPKFELPKLSLDRVFPKPLFPDAEGHLRKIREAFRQKNSKHDEKPVSVSTPEDAPTKVFAISYFDAKKWDELHEQLKLVKKELEDPSLQGSKRKERNDLVKTLNQRIAHLRNQTGRLSDSEMYDALGDAYRREYKQHLLMKPDESDLDEFVKWDKKLNFLTEKLERYGFGDPVEQSDLIFKAPIIGIQAQKQAERKEEYERALRERQAAKEKDKEKSKPKPQPTPKPLEIMQEEKGSSLETAVENAYAKSIHDPSGRHYVPDVLVNLSEQPDLISKELFKIRGVPVTLVDITEKHNPITQNDNRAMVVVDIDGLRLPYYLANGDEPSGREIPGRWYPALNISRDGKWDFSKRKYIDEEDDPENIEELFDIADALDDRIGDIRNYSNQDGTVGGVDAIDHVDSDIVFRAVDKLPNTINHKRIWQDENHNTFMKLYALPLRTYFEQIEAPDYDERAERRRLQQEWRDEKRTELKEFGQRMVSKIQDDIGKIANLFRKRFRVNDDLHEYE